MSLPQLAQQQQQQQHQQHQSGAGAGLGAGAGGLGGLGGLGDGGSLGGLGAGAAELTQLRELVTQNPSLLQPMIQQLAQSNPQLAQYLEQNPEALMQLLANFGGEGLEGDDALGGPGQLPPGAQVVHITPEERDAIERVCLLSSPKPLWSDTRTVDCAWLHTRPSNRGIFCMRQERGTRCKLLVREWCGHDGPVKDILDVVPLSLVPRSSHYIANCESLSNDICIIEHALFPPSTLLLDRPLAKSY